MSRSPGRSGSAPAPDPFAAMSESPRLGGDSPLRAVAAMALVGLVFPLMNANAKYLGAHYPLPEVVWARFASHVVVCVLLLGPRFGRNLFRTRHPVLQGWRGLMLFGASASQLSGAQTAQLASTVTALATGGGFDVLGSLRQFAGLDRLAIGGDQVSGVTVAGGKYITNDVYLEIIGGGREGPTAEVDWRIRRGFSIVSQLGGQFGARLAVRWTHDIGRRRARTGGR